MSSKWEFWAKRYDRLWVQRVILGPSQQLVFKRMQGSNIQPTRLLDIGCGTGLFVAEVAERYPACEVVACDTSPTMLEHARIRCADERVVFVEESVPDIVHQEPFDVITCMHVLPYLPEAAVAIQRMHDILGMNGHLFVVNATTESLWDRVVLGVFKLLVSRAYYPSAAATRDAMRSAGLTDIRATHVSVPWWVPSITLVEGRRPT